MTLGAEPLFSVIVPTLDEEAALPAALDHLAGLAGRWEVIVADGGSRDATLGVALGHEVVDAVVEASGGRARQLDAAAERARGELFVFLHADSRLPRDAYATLGAALGDPGAEGGAFALRFDGADRFSRVLGAWYAAQRRLGVYYGDSTLWVRPAVFAALGGFRALPIMDDYDFVRRLERRGRTRCLPGPATTSARRWRALGIPRTIASWALIRWLYVAGVPAERLARLYRAVR